MKGKLYIVGTPIGNLEDITYRAARILAEVDLVAAEDTRRSLQLLNHLGCPKTLISYHEHNRKAAGIRLIERLKEGATIALVTDAGMPCISDPGWELVAQASVEGIPVEVIPGPSAVIAAVARSGMDSSCFVFEGFLPRKGKERKMALERVASRSEMTVLYEAPHRLEKVLEDLTERCGDRPAVLCKDLTKQFEKVLRGSLSDLLATVRETEIKGEYVIILGPRTPRPSRDCSSKDMKQRLRELVRSGISKSDAVRQVVAETGLPRKEVYAVSVSLSDDDAS